MGSPSGLPLFFLMYSITDIQDCVFGLDGWKESLDPCLPKLSTEMQESRSGQFFNSRHPNITIENLKAIAPDFDGLNYPLYDALTTYNTDDIVKIESQVTGGSNRYFKSLIDNNTGNQPEDSPTEWEEQLYFSDWLEDKTRQSIARLLNNVITLKKLNKDTKGVLENVKLYDGVGRIQETITNQGDFVGFQIELNKLEDLRVGVSRMGLQLTQAQDLDIYLYHSSQVDPLQVQTVSYTKAGSMQWIDLVDIFDLRYYNANSDSGGAYYLGYFQDDLVGNAVKKTKNFTRPCARCDRMSYLYYNTWNKFFTVNTFEVANSELNGTQLWDIADNKYTYSTNYGLNVEFTSVCDITDFICRKQNILIEPVITQVTYDLLYEMSLNTRDNELANKVMSKAQNSLAGSETIEAYQMTLNNQIKSLNFDLSDLSKVCMPCSNKGIKVRGV